MSYAQYIADERKPKGYTVNIYRIASNNIASVCYNVAMAQSSLLHSDVLLELMAHVAGADGQYRTLSDKVLSGKLAMPDGQAAVSQAWKESLEGVVGRVGDVSNLGTEAVRANPMDEATLASVYTWLQEQGLPDLSGPSSVSVFGCRAAPFHHDMWAFGDSLFCVVWTSEDAGLELVFPQMGRRVPLEMGTVIVFDSGQPHGVLWKGKKHYVAKSYEQLPVQTFISVDFGAMLDGVMEHMGIRAFDTPAGWPGLVVGEGDAGPKMQPRTGRWIANP
jgi:hypothetical protein